MTIQGNGSLKVRLRFGQMAAPALNQPQQGFHAALVRIERSCFIDTLEGGIELLLPNLQNAQIRPTRRLRRANLSSARQILLRSYVFTSLQSSQTQIESGAEVRVRFRAWLGQP